MPPDLRWVSYGFSLPLPALSYEFQSNTPIGHPRHPNCVGRAFGYRGAQDCFPPGESVLSLFIIVLILRQNRYAPAALVLVLFGAAIMLVKGYFYQISLSGFSFPAFTGFSLEELWQSLVHAGFAQVP